MYNQTYEEYMRSVLGYMPNNQDMEYTYNRNDVNMYYNMPANYMQYNMEVCNVDHMYPEIYNIVYPMIRKSCSNYMGEITEEKIEKMTMDIFNNLEEDMSKRNEQNVQNRKLETKTNTKIEENIQENRNRNPLLKDLIRILILRELIGGNRLQRPSYPGPVPRPLYPGQGPRPPFPGPGPRPAFPGNSIQPRVYEDDMNY